MLEAINRQLDRLFPQTAVWTEPGRFLCGTAMNLVTSVIGTKQRGAVPWYILDEGIYGVFSGILFDHWEYPLHCFGNGAKIPSVFAGPSCDGIDVLYRDFPAPKLPIGANVLVSDIAPTRPSRPRASTASNPPPSSSGKTRPTSSPSAASSVKPMRHPAHRLHRCPDTQRYS